MHVPRLEDSDRSLSNADRQTFLSGGVSSQNPDQVVNFIKNLERFCNEVADNKLFWTPEVIAFFGITDEKLKKEYEFAREDLQRQMQSNKDGQLGGNHYRRQSYVNLERALVTDNEIQEESSDGGSGSTKNAKKTAPAFFGGEITSRPAANSAAELGQASHNQAIYTEDLQNSLHEELRNGQYPLSVKFLMW